MQRLTRSPPDSLAATVAAQPSMSLVPLAPFLGFAQYDKLNGCVESALVNPSGKRFNLAAANCRIAPGV
jgi:hypothetical protein